MKKKILTVLVCVIFLLSLVGCNSKDKEEQFLGKTSAEIEREYGRFDCVIMPISEDGLYRSCRCGYTIAEEQAGFWGTSPEILLYISFDENGVSISCEEGYRPGG